MLLFVMLFLMKTRSRFHLHFTWSFYTQRSQMCPKLKLSDFLLFWDLRKLNFRVKCFCRFHQHFPLEFSYKIKLLSFSLITVHICDFLVEEYQQKMCKMLIKLTPAKIDHLPVWMWIRNSFCTRQSFSCHPV